MAPLRLLRWVSGLAALAIVGCASSERVVTSPKSGPQGHPRAEHLVPLLTLDNPRLVETAALIATAGDAREAQFAGERLAALASQVAGDGWSTVQRDIVARTMAEPHDAAVDAEVERRRREALVRIYDAMKPLRVPAVAAHCLARLGSAHPPVEQRLAFAVLVAQGLAAPGAEPTGPSRSASNVVAGMRQRFRACYRQELQRDPSAVGRVTLVAKIDQNGRVVSVTPSATPFSSELVSCLGAVVAEGRFSPPEGGGATVTIPIAFLPDEPAHITARMSGRFRECYRAAQLQPTRRALVTFYAEIVAKGAVRAVTHDPSDVPPELLRCLEAVIWRGGFSAPPGGSARVTIPVTFAAR